MDPQKSIALLTSIAVAGCSSPPVKPPEPTAVEAPAEPPVPDHIEVGGDMLPRLDALLLEQDMEAPIEDRLRGLAELFLGTDYKKNTLIGGPKTPEQLIINITGMDCSTYIDYVVAGATANTYDDFVRNVANMRYWDGTIEYQFRNHFFTHLVENNDNLTDATSTICSAAVTTEERILNRKQRRAKKAKKRKGKKRKSKKKQQDKPEYWVPGIPTSTRTISYIDFNSLAQENCRTYLQDGDILGLVPRKKNGLDVGHIGIVFYDYDAKKQPLMFYHAARGKDVRKQHLWPYLYKNRKKFKGVTVVRVGERFR